MFSPRIAKSSELNRTFSAMKALNWSIMAAIVRCGARFCSATCRSRRRKAKRR